MRSYPGLLAGCILFVFSSAGVALAEGDQTAPNAWRVDYAKSRLAFEGTQTGAKFHGEFQRFEAAIIFDPQNLPESSIAVSIDTASARTGDRQRDSALPGPDWFAAKTYPAARFLSSQIRQTPDGAYEAVGTLTIRDVARDLTLPFTLSLDGDNAKAHGAATLVRTDFGVGRGEFESGEWVGLDVQVVFDISATRNR